MLRSVAPDTVLSCTRANMHASAGTSCNLNGQAYVPRDVNLGSFKKKLIYCTNKTVNMIHEFLLETSRSYFLLWSYFLQKVKMWTFCIYIHSNLYCIILCYDAFICQIFGPLTLFLLSLSCLLQVNPSPSPGSERCLSIPSRVHCIVVQVRVQPHIADSYLSPILYLMDGKLHRNVEAVQNVAPKHQSVLWSVDSMDPALIANMYVKR